MAAARTCNSDGMTPDPRAPEIVLCALPKRSYDSFQLGVFGVRGA